MTNPIVIYLSVALLIGFFSWGLARFRLLRKARAYESKKRCARIEQQIGGGHPPSWYKRANRQEDFFAGVDRLATRRGVPSSYAQTVLEKEVNVRRLSWYVGALEDQGASWEEQQMAVAEQLSEWWAAEERAKRIFN